MKDKKGRITTTAKALRRTSTDVENLLWKQLRNKRLAGLKFRRQQPIDNYIVDFGCFEKRVVIEVDGGQHTTEKDAERDDYLIRNGFKILRFWNNEVLQTIEGVMEEIGKHC